MSDTFLNKYYIFLMNIVLYHELNQAFGNNFIKEFNGYKYDKYI